MEESQERRIAVGLRAGAADAWAALYDAFAEPVWRAVARLLGPSSADVADVVQETFLAAARSAQGYDAAKGSLGGWLHGIARRHVALWYRKQSQQDRLKAGVWNNGQPVHFAGELARPEEIAERAELAAQVRAILVELPDDYVYLLTAKYLDDVSVTQLAAEQRCTEVALRSKLARAREAFRQRFAMTSGAVRTRDETASGGVQPRREPLPPA